MTATPAISASVSIAPFMVGGACLSLAWWLRIFEPCRVHYRVRNLVQDTFQCQLFSVSGLIGIPLLFVDSIAAIMAAYSVIRQRWRAVIRSNYLPHDRPRHQQIRFRELFSGDTTLN